MIRNSKDNFFCAVCGSNEFIYPIIIANVKGAGCLKCGFFNTPEVLN